jgi:hypothetical protein
VSFKPLIIASSLLTTTMASSRQSWQDAGSATKRIGSFAGWLLLQAAQVGDFLISRSLDVRSPRNTSHRPHKINRDCERATSASRSQSDVAATSSSNRLV